MVDGGVSIAVPSIYPGKQRASGPTKCCGRRVKQPEKSCAEQKISSTMSSNRIIVPGTIRIVGGLVREFLTVPGVSSTCERSFKQCSCRQRSFAR